MGNLGKDVSLSLKYLSSALKSTKIHNFRVWHKEYFVGKPSKKVCVFSFSVNFLIIFSKSVISINRKEDAPDLRIDNIIKFRYHYYNSELQKKMNNKQEKKKWAAERGVGVGLPLEEEVSSAGAEKRKKI